MRRIRGVAIVGPTASGKTALSIELARRIGGEIIICDSMQIYRRMDIGTAKATADEQRAVPHHLIDIRDVNEKYSASNYAEDAHAAAENILSRGKVPIFCGGTGLYLDSLTRNNLSPETAPDGKIRRELIAESRREGGRESLYRELCEVDPEAAAAIHINNVRRVIRALEIFRTSGVTKTEWDRRSREAGGDFDLLTFTLSFACRDLLRERIDRRVEEMFAEGLESEARSLFEEGLLGSDTTAGQAIGYKELAGYFRGENTLEEAKELIKTATHKYAKRQMTWFSSHRDYYTLSACDGERVRTVQELADEILPLALAHIRKDSN